MSHSICLLTNPLDYVAIFIIEFTDDKWAYAIKVIDHFQVAAYYFEDDPTLSPALSTDSR